MRHRDEESHDIERLFTLRLMKITYNGTSLDTTATTLAAFLQAQGLAAQRLAAGINGQFVPRAAWDATALSAGDDIVVVQAACGG